MSREWTGSVYQYLLDTRVRHGAVFMALLDPDRATPEQIGDHAALVRQKGLYARLAGSQNLDAETAA